MGVDLLDISRLHTDAVAALLVAAGYPVYVVEVADLAATDPYPYLALYPEPGQVDATNLEATPSQFTFGWQVTAVGRDRSETQAALDRARMTLLGARPTVTGRTCGLVEQVPLRTSVRQDPSERDPATQRPVFYGVAQYTVMSVPA